MIRPGEVISYLDMCQEEGANLQRGMNFHFRKTKISVILMSLRRGAPYSDRVEENGKVLIYEGHDAQKTNDVPNPKTIDQPMALPSGVLTENGKFFNAAIQHKNSGGLPELVRALRQKLN